MSLIDSDYEVSESMVSVLQFWLLMDLWKIAEATQILAGFDPDKTIESGTKGDHHYAVSITLFNGSLMPDPRYVDDEMPPCYCGEEDCYECGWFNATFEHRQEDEKRLNAYLQKCKDIARLFNNPSTNPTSPTEWIERALSKKIKIPWLKWVSERGLLPADFNRKILAIGKTEFIRQIDNPASDCETENPQVRRERIRARVREEEAKGTKAFLQVVAKEEGLSTSRIKQLINDDTPAKNVDSPWEGMLANTRQTSSKKTDSKY